MKLWMTVRRENPLGLTKFIKNILIVLSETHGPLLLKLVNKSEHIYPTCWTVNFLKPIFKKGDKYDPDNFRRLVVRSAFAKSLVNFC